MREERKSSGDGFCPEPSCFAALVLCCSSIGTAIRWIRQETEQNFFGLRSDVEKLSLAVYLAQLCAQVAPAEEEAGEFLRLILNSLYLLEKDKRPQRLVKAVFELRLLAMGGLYARSGRLQGLRLL